MKKDNLWSRKLYIKTSLPDNHVDKSFLKLKKTNLNARIYTYWSSVYHSGLIVHQLSSVIIFVLIYVYLKAELINVNELMFFYVIPFSLAGYTAKLVATEMSFYKIQRDLSNLIKFVSFSFGLSPILNSLTESISSDTIYAGATLMLILNLLFHDYDSFEVALVSKTFSFNAALFACVCLTSRFQSSSFHTFALITISFILFALLPEYRRYVQHKYSYGILWMTLLNLFLCVVMLLNLRLWSFLMLYLLTIFIVSFVCPAILIKLQVYKNTIHGPWDEAIVNC